MYLEEYFSSLTDEEEFGYNMPKCFGQTTEQQHARDDMYDAWS